MDEAWLRCELVRAAQELLALGLNRGTSGNLSVRCGSGFLITPSGVGAELTEDDVVYMTMEGEATGRWRPSTEWRLHRSILAASDGFSAVVHTHAIAASAVACLRRDIPPFHYMVARMGGDTIRCAEYAAFGTQRLADHALEAMQGRKACLLANHGMIAAGADLAEAVGLTVEVETLSEIYLRVLAVGPPALLSDDEFREAQERFADYGVRKGSEG